MPGKDWQVEISSEQNNRSTERGFRRWGQFRDCAQIGLPVRLDQRTTQMRLMPRSAPDCSRGALAKRYG